MGSGTCNLDSIKNPIADCTTCQPDEIGNTAIILSESYCTEDKKDDPFCQDVNTAIASGSDPTTIGNALLASMQ